MTTLFDVMKDALGVMGVGGYRGTVTYGATGYMTDTGCNERDGYFNGGLAFFLSGADKGIANPITTWVLSTHTYNYSTLAVAPTAGDAYLAIPKLYTKTALKTAVNMALADIGAVMLTNSTVTADGDAQTYTLPAGVRNVKRVIVDGAPNYHWEERNGYIYFDKGKVPEGTLEIWYAGMHPELVNDTDLVSVSIEPIRLIWMTAFYAANVKALDGDTRAKQLVAMATDKLTLLNTQYPTRLIYRDPKHASW
jgi:hypothetical protein